MPFHAKIHHFLIAFNVSRLNN